MYECKNCGGMLRFDIPTQKLKCDYCDSLFEVEEFEDRSYRKAEYETNVFLCPQCGGEIFTQDNDLTGRCSYCGTTQVFTCRVETIERPKWIIPFKQDKESCKRKYTEAVKKAFFAPKEIKDTEFIDSIRGIFMPYWFYECDFDRDLPLTGIRKSGTKITGKMVTICRGRLDNRFHARFVAMQEDASSWYSDEISDNVRPYILSRSDIGMQDFNPAYLCGFYGETADVEKPSNHKKVKYDNDVKEKAEYYVYHKYDSSHLMEHGFEILRKDPKSDFEMGLLPVWFLSYNKNNRVSYSVINGQNGHFSAEFPVNLKKFLACTAGLAAILYVILNFFWIMRPEYVAMAAAIGALWSIRLSTSDLIEIVRKECELRPLKFRENTQKPERKGINVSVKQLIPYLLVILLVFMEINGHIDRYPHGLMARIPLLFTIGVTGFATYEICQYLKNVQTVARDIRVKVFPGNLLAYLAILASLVVQILSPVSDYAYYLAGFGCMVMTILCLLSVVFSYNRMATRKMPQFEHMGGDDCAK